ncbi:MAG: hypothetical protein J5710_03530 [Treponema sp.]|nr:hypothetical protein [Treponema sp.]MBR5645184.1 hypothetical protein [Treponema sp.]
MSNGLISNGYFHKQEYWNKNSGIFKDLLIRVESFAHFGEARGCGGIKLDFMKECFSTAYKIYEDLL